MAQVKAVYEKAIKGMMKAADSDGNQDVEEGWPNNMFGDAVVDEEVREELDRDLKSVLIDKATGSVHTRVMNNEAKGGLRMYLDVYK